MMGKQVRQEALFVVGVNLEKRVREDHPMRRIQARRRRTHLMERSFGDAANNHGFKRSRWRGLWGQRVQDYLIAAVQNIRGAKCLASVMDLLRSLRPHKDCPNRKLHFDESVAYLLLYFFNPILTSLRGLQQASTFRKVNEKLGLPRFSLGSFSEARNVLAPSLLEPLIAAMVKEVGETGAEQYCSRPRFWVGKAVWSSSCAFVDA